MRTLVLQLINNTCFNCGVCCSESEVEHFGKFMQNMKEGVTKMRAKFIDHCNQMSGRKSI